MPDGQQYDLSQVAQDPGFVNANIMDKIAYLSAHDSDFAKANVKDKVDYIQHLIPTGQQLTGREKAGTGNAFMEDIKAPLSMFSDLDKQPQQTYSSAKEEFEAKQKMRQEGNRKIKEEYAARKAAGYSTPYALAAPVVEGVANVKGMEESAQSGDTGGVLGHMAAGQTMAASPLILEGATKGVGKLADVASNARESIGKSIHVPETGELTPTASNIGRGAGAGIGGTIGGGVGSVLGPGGTYTGAGVGATSGAILGPSLMERMFPEPAEIVAARNAFKTTQEITEANEAALKEAQTRANAERIAKTRALREEQQSRDQLWEARDQYAQDLMNRQSAQDKLDAAEIKAANAAARAKKEGFADQAALEQMAKKAAQDAEDSRNQHAQDLMDRQKQQDALDAKHAKALKNLEDIRQKELADIARFRRMTEPTEETASPEGNMPLKGNPTPFSNPQDLIYRTKKIVKPGEAPSAEDLKRAGDMTQVPLAKLKLLASWGDELARNEINRRIRNQ